MLIKKSFFCFIASILIIYQSFSQEVDESYTFTIFDVDSKSVLRVDLLSQKLNIYQTDSIPKVFPLKFTNFILHDLDSKYNIRSFKKSKSEFYISVNGTGQIYSLNLENKELERIDRTFYRGYNFNNVSAFRKDTIFAFGGTGFWQANNVATYFTPKQKEWERYKGTNPEGAPARFSSTFGGYDESLDKIFVAEEAVPYINDINSFSNPFFVYDFKTKTWSKLGTIKSLRNEFRVFGKIDAHWIGGFLFAHNFNPQIWFIDPNRNVIYRYKGKNELIFHKTQKLIHKGNYFYSFKNISEQNNDYRVLIDSIHVDSLIKGSIVVGKLYTPSSVLDDVHVYHLVCFLLIILVLVQWISFQKWKKSKSYFVRKDLELPEHALVFLNFIFNQKNNICTTEDLNKILQCSDKSIENQRQMRSKFISSLNTFIENQYHLPEAILRVPSEFDKRFVHYTILSSALKAIEQLLK
jgi:hypothetical protein